MSRQPVKALQTTAKIMSKQSSRGSGRKPEITLQFATRKPTVPRAADIRAWATAALRDKPGAQLTIRIVAETEGTELNQQWRGKPGPTNVLSFPSEGIAEIAPDLLGDIVICAPVVAEEARQQGKELQAHWAHMVIHGTLHLLGHDHQVAGEAAIMEQIETDILRDFGYPDPYNMPEPAVMD